MIALLQHSSPGIASVSLGKISRVARAFAERNNIIGTVAPSEYSSLVFTRRPGTLSHPLRRPQTNPKRISSPPSSSPSVTSQVQFESGVKNFA